MPTPRKKSPAKAAAKRKPAAKAAARRKAKTTRKPAARSVATRVGKSVGKGVSTLMKITKRAKVIYGEGKVAWTTAIKQATAELKKQGVIKS